jgi:pimeloyl-ACP methyl ester carboxylesterase
VKGFARHSLARDGLPLALHVEEGEGPLVFMQHGLCGDAAQPAAVFPRDAGVRLAVLECRGHGNSPAGNPQDFSIATFAEDIAAAIAATSGRPVIAGGISMGAAIAKRLACTRPELIKGLVIARPAWTFAPAPANMTPNLEVGRILARPPQPGEVEEFLASATGRRLAAEAPDNLASLAGFFRRAPRAVTADLLTRISQDGPGVTEAQLAALDLPTLVIGHEEDAIHPMAHARTLAAVIPGAKLVEIPPKARGLAAYQDAFRVALARFIKETM